MADIADNVPFTDAATAISQGRRHLLVRDYTMAVTALTQACELLVKKHGDMADELGEPYLLYGRALLGLAREEAGVLGGGVPGSEEAQGEEDAEDDDEDEEDAEDDDEEKVNKIEEKEEEEEDDDEEKEDEKKDEEEKKTTIESVETTIEDTTTVKKNEKEDKSEKNEKEEKKETNEKNEKEEEEEVIKKKENDEKEEKTVSKSESESTSKNNETTTDDNDASVATSSKQQNGNLEENGDHNSEDISKEDEEEEANNLQVAWEVLELAKLVLLKRGQSGWKLLAESYRLLGEVAMEGGNHKEALSDLQGCLDLLEKIDPREPRAIAEIHYQLGLAHSLGNEFDASIEEFNKATKLLESRIKELEAITEPPKTDDPFYTIEGEIQELKDLLPEIQEKITDMQEFKDEACKLAIANLKSGSSNGAGPSSDASNSSPGNATNPQTVKPASDISHLLRKKRKTAEEPETEVPMPPCKKPTPEKAV